MGKGTEGLRDSGTEGAAGPNDRRHAVCRVRRQRRSNDLARTPRPIRPAAATSGGPSVVIAPSVPQSLSPSVPSHSAATGWTAP